MSYELLSSDKIIRDAMVADAGMQAALPGGVAASLHKDIAPAGSQPPYIVFSVAGFYDVNAIGGDRAMSPATYTIRASAPGVGYAALRPIAKAIDKVMRKIGPVVVEGVEVGRFVRQSGIMMSDEVSNETWYHLGGVYETVLSEAQIGD